MHACDMTSHTLAHRKIAKFKSATCLAHDHMEQSAKFSSHTVLLVGAAGMILQLVPVIVTERGLSFLL